jgi:hypothetical protein
MYELESLVERYERSKPSTRRRGRTWYPEANRRLTLLARETGHAPAQAVAVFAITSMNTQLLSNFRLTEQVLRGQRTFGCYPVFQTPLISAALTTRYPGRFVKGPKCTQFYKAIMGDTNALVLDRWAARAAGLNVRTFNMTTRRILEAAYREAARICGETVRSFQAIVWTDVRESTPGWRGTVPNLADITR